MNYNRLIDEHDEIDRLGRQLLAICSARPTSCHSAWRTMWAIVFMLHAHWAGEEANLYAALLRDDDPEAAPIASQFAAEMEKLERDWRAHTARWTAPAIANDWTAFGETTRAMTARLSERTHAETRRLYPFALKKSIIERDITATV